LSAGIYKILNLKDGKFYIGSSLDLERRQKEHFDDLRKNIHHNVYLQNAYNKHGRGNFKFITLETIDTSNRKEIRNLEQSYLDNLIGLQSYNISKHADGGLTAPPIIGGNHIRHRKISVFDLNGIFIEEVCGLRQCEKKYNSHGIYDCCKGKTKSSKGFIFKYSDELDVTYVPKIREWKSDNPIYCYDVDKELVGIYNTVFNASKKLKISRESISKILSGKKVRNCNYSFIYKNQTNVVSSN